MSDSISVFLLAEVSLGGVASKARSGQLGFSLPMGLIYAGSVIAKAQRVAVNLHPLPCV